MDFVRIPTARARRSKRILYQIETVVPTDTSALILGETGTGKELVAPFTTALESIYLNVESAKSD